MLCVRLKCTKLMPHNNPVVQDLDCIGGRCSVYYLCGMQFRDRQGYCPIGSPVAARAAKKKVNPIKASKRRSK